MTKNDNTFDTYINVNDNLMNNENNYNDNDKSENIDDINK